MFYFWEAVLLLAAFIIGWLLTVFVPRFFYDASQRILAWGRSLGLGAAILILTPVAVIICCVTLVGIPLGVITFLLYLIALYMAKIFVGAFLGRALLGQREAGQRHNLMALFLGLLLLTIATHIPFVGGIIAVAMLCFGLGALGWQLYREVHAGRAAA
jgi:hypothetical protein